MVESADNWGQGFEQTEWTGGDAAAIPADSSREGMQGAGPFETAVTNPGQLSAEQAYPTLESVHAGMIDDDRIQTHMPEPTRSLTDLASQPPRTVRTGSTLLMMVGHDQYRLEDDEPRIIRGEN